MKRTMYYTQCDICGKKDIFDGVEFAGSDWHHDHKIDECLNCNEKGYILHKEDLFEEEKKRGKHIKGVWYWVPYRNDKQ